MKLKFVLLLVALRMHLLALVTSEGITGAGGLVQAVLEDFYLFLAVGAFFQLVIGHHSIFKCVQFIFSDKFE